MKYQHTEKQNAAKNYKKKLAEILQPQFGESSLVTVLVLLLLVGSLIFVLFILFGLYLGQFQHVTHETGVAKRFEVPITNGSSIHLKVNLEEDSNIQATSPLPSKVVVSIKNEGENTAESVEYDGDVVEEEKKEEKMKKAFALAGAYFQNQAPRTTNWNDNSNPQRELFLEQFDHFSDMFKCANVLAQNCSTDSVTVQLKSIDRESRKIATDFVVSLKTFVDSKDDDKLDALDEVNDMLIKFKHDFMFNPIDLCPRDDDDDDGDNGDECEKCLRKNVDCYKVVTDLWGRS